MPSSRHVRFLEKEAFEVYEIVKSVEMGIRLGHNLMTQVKWKVPSDGKLKNAIVDHLFMAW